MSRIDDAASRLLEASEQQVRLLIAIHSQLEALTDLARASVPLAQETAPGQLPLALVEQAKDMQDWYSY